MKKETIASLIVVILAVPLTIWLGAKIPGRGYYPTIFIIAAEALIPVLISWRGKRIKLRHWITLGVLCVLAMASRVLVPLPSFKPTFGVIMLFGIAFGPQTGFFTGAVGAVLSDCFLGQGPFTPWQMLGYGCAGLLGGLLFAKNRLPRKSLIMAVAGFISVLVVVGPVLDTSSVFYMWPLSAQSMLRIYRAGVSINATNGLCSGIFLFLFGKFFLQKLDRVKIEFGMTGETEDEI